MKTTQLDKIKDAVKAASPGEWSWHNRATMEGKIVGYDVLQTEDDYVIRWRNDGLLEISEPDAHLIENAKDYLIALLEVVEAAAVIEASPDEFNLDFSDKGLSAWQDLMTKVRELTKPTSGTD